MTFPLTERMCAGCGSSFLGRGRAKWCSQKCRRDTLYARTCIDCGARLNSSAGHGPHAPKRCLRCNGVLAGERNVQRWLPHRRLIEGMWAQGMTALQIGQAIGWTTKHPSAFISELRRRGYDLPHRRSPEQIARIVAASEGHLARARAIYAERRMAA